MNKLTFSSHDNVTIEEITTLNISKALVIYVDEVEDNKMTHLKEYLSVGMLPSDKKKD